MMNHRKLVDVLYLHEQLILQSGGAPGLRDRGGLEAALAQPRMTFGGADLYPTLADKAAAICFSLVMRHPFVDGNKRVGYAAMRLLLDLNGWTIQAQVDDAEEIVLQLAAGQLPREQFSTWVHEHAAPKPQSAQ